MSTVRLATFRANLEDQRAPEKRHQVCPTLRGGRCMTEASKGRDKRIWEKAGLTMAKKLRKK